MEVEALVDKETAQAGQCHESKVSASKKKKFFRLNGLGSVVTLGSTCRGRQYFPTNIFEIMRTPNRLVGFIAL